MKIVESGVITFNPKGPKNHRTKDALDTTNHVELLWNAIGENPLLPRKKAPWALSISVGDQGIHNMYAPLPRLLYQLTLPKPMKNYFVRFKRTNKAAGVDRMVNSTPPRINRHSSMPNGPQKSCFFWSASFHP